MEANSTRVLRLPWGSASRSVNTEADLDSLMVPAERIDAVVKEDVLLMKVRAAAGVQPYLVMLCAWHAGEGPPCVPAGPKAVHI